MVFWFCKSIIICVSVSKINYLFHFLSGTKCLNPLFLQSSGSFLYDPTTVDNSHSEQTLVLLTAVPLLWMMMEDVKILLFTFFTLHWTVNTAIQLLYVLQYQWYIFSWQSFSRKLVAWLDITHVEFQAYRQKIFNFIVSQNISKEGFQIFLMRYTSPLEVKKQREKTAWLPFVVTVTVFFH